MSSFNDLPQFLVELKRHSVKGTVNFPPAQPLTDSVAIFTVILEHFLLVRYVVFKPGNTNNRFRTLNDQISMARNRGQTDREARYKRQLLYTLATSHIKPSLSSPSKVYLPGDNTAKAKERTKFRNH